MTTWCFVLFYQRDISHNRCREKGINVTRDKKGTSTLLLGQLTSAVRSRLVTRVILWSFVEFLVTQGSYSLHRNHRGTYIDTQIVVDFSSLWTNHQVLLYPKFYSFFFKPDFNPMGIFMGLTLRCSLGIATVLQTDLHRNKYIFLASPLLQHPFHSNTLKLSLSSFWLDDLGHNLIIFLLCWAFL